jgi:DNA-directed RNA polymerase specialized sigma24 family protein
MATGLGRTGGGGGRSGAGSRAGAGVKLVRSGHTHGLGSEPTRDLRTSSLRREADAIVERAGRLLPEDRTLLAMVFRDGRSAASVARVMGVSAKRVRGRVRRLLDRIDSPLFRFVAANAQRWPEAQRVVAIALFVEGLSLREAGRRLGMSYYTVRQIGLVVRAAFLAHEDGMGRGVEVAA